MKYYISDESQKSLKCNINGISLTIDKLYKLLDKKGWCMMSAFNKKAYNEKNKCIGQCNGTVILIQELFGGKIIKYSFSNQDKKTHYFNRINDVNIDLTSDQFNEILDYESQQEVYKEDKRYHFIYEKSAYILKLRIFSKRILKKLLRN